KLLFKVELSLRDEIATPSYLFIRHNFGPYAVQVFQDSEALEDCGVAAMLARSREDGRVVGLTQRGHQIRDWLCAELADNHEWQLITHAVDEAAAFASTQSAMSLQHWSHELKIRPDSRGPAKSIHDMAMGDVILNPAWWEGASQLV